MRITEIEREEACQKIIKHIIRCGCDKSFKVTPKLMKYWWKYLNAAVFENKLDTNTLFISAQMFYRAGQVYGYCVFDVPTNRSEIKMDSLNIPKDLGKIGFLIILVHEMVHQYQHEYSTYPGHGKSFSAWTTIIKDRLGLPLSELIETDQVWECYESIKQNNNN